MKTVFIYDQCGETPIRYFIAEGDYSHLDGLYINDSRDTNAVEELLHLLGEDETGYCELLEEFPLQEVRDGAIVVAVGFVP